MLQSKNLHHQVNQKLLEKITEAPHAVTTKPDNTQLFI